jgi:hypothetical protein
LAATSALIVGGISLLPQGTRYRIVPIAGQSYPQSFLKLASTRTFKSLSHALNSIRDPRLTFHIEPIA